jgi:trimeric autotransporter adhesin
MSWSGTPYYGQAQTVLAALQYLGINTIRDQPPGYTADPVVTAADDTLAVAGVKFDAILLSLSPVNLTGNLAQIDAFNQQYPGVISSIEGPNEINYQPITYGRTTNTYLAGNQVMQALKADNKLAVPIYSLTIGISTNSSGEDTVGNLSPYVSYGNAHVYACCSNNVWQVDAPYWLGVEGVPTQGKTTVVTETGYSANTTDALSSAKYNLNTLFENAMNGVARTFLYELVDIDTTSSDQFGQYYNNWTPKVGATAIHNLTTILAGAGSGTAASRLNYTVSGLPSGTGHTFLLGSSTMYELAVWVDATVYNPTTGADLTAPTNTVTVSLGGTYSNVKVFDPMVGTTAIASYATASSVTVSVSDHPLIIQIP